MGARAEAAQKTYERILEAGVEASLEAYYEEFTLKQIADKAGVTVQTVLRRFGSKEGLVEAVVARINEKVWTQMESVPVGDVRAAIAALHDRYEWMGDSNIRMLAQEERVRPIADMVEASRTWHVVWIERTFAPHLPDAGPDRDRRMLQFILLCDVYTWKLMRRDHAGDRDATFDAVLELLEPHIRVAAKEES